MQNTGRCTVRHNECITIKLVHVERLQPIDFKRYHQCKYVTYLCQYSGDYLRKYKSKSWKNTLELFKLKVNLTRGEIISTSGSQIFLDHFTCFKNDSHYYSGPRHRQMMRQTLYASYSNIRTDKLGLRVKYFERQNYYYLKKGNAKLKFEIMRNA